MIAPRRRQSEIYRRSPAGRLERRCLTCGHWFPRDGFHRDRRGVPQAHCQHCYRERARRRMATKRNHLPALSKPPQQVVDVLT